MLRQTNSSYIDIPQEISWIPGGTLSGDNKTKTLNYGDTAPKSFPFDIYESYAVRIRSMANGAIYAINNDPNKQPEEKDRLAKQVKELVERKIAQLKLFKKKTQHQHQSVSFKVELSKFYYQELPKAAGYTAKQIALAETFYIWQDVKRQERTTTYTKTLGNNKGQLRIEQKDEPDHSALTDTQKKELLRIHDTNVKKRPKWFRALDPWAQESLEKIIPDNLNGNWENYQKCHPTILRHIPGEANALIHTLTITHVSPDMKANVISKSSQRRQGVPTSFNMEDRQERQNSANGNLDQMLARTLVDAEQAFKDRWGIDYEADLPFPILFGGLLTPSHQAGLTGKALDFSGASEGESNTRLTREKEIAIAQCQKPALIKVFNLNVPVNRQRSGAIQPDQGFIEFARNLHQKLNSHHVSQTEKLQQCDIGRQNKLQQLLAAVNQLSVLGVNPELPGRNRNTHLAALYDLTMRLMGGLSTENCKSSKDRVGTEIMMADAMLVYYAEQKAAGIENPQFPAHDDEGKNRERFVEIFCELYASGHQLLLAHDNSLGCPGIKNEGMLDKDIIQKLTEMGVYTQSKQIADFNKPGSLWKKHGSTIQRYTAITGFVTLSAVSAGLMATGILSPLSFVGAALAAKVLATGVSTTVIAGATTVAAGAAGAMIMAGCTKLIGGILELVKMRKTFTAQIKKIEKRYGVTVEAERPVNVGGGTHADVLRTVGRPVAGNGKKPNRPSPQPRHHKEDQKPLLLSHQRSDVRPDDAAGVSSGYRPSLIRQK